jgi:hypothetical protein
MPAIHHCRHCYGDCPGDCLIPGGGGACIHRRASVSFRQQLRIWLWRLRSAGNLPFTCHVWRPAQRKTYNPSDRW